jgi:hypothetical protein
MSMRLKLAFSHTTGDLFRVHAVPFFDVSMGESKRDPVTIEYVDEGVFLYLLEEADLDAAQHAQVVGAIAALAVSPNTPACCEDVSVNESQLLILLNGAIRSRLA